MPAKFPRCLLIEMFMQDTQNNMQCHVRIWSGFPDTKRMSNWLPEKIINLHLNILIFFNGNKWLVL